MNFKDNLNSRRQTPVATFHKFRVDPSIHSRPHIFVEGYDDVQYYSKYIRAPNKQQPRFHICYGKKNLDNILSLYYGSAFHNGSALFVRDSDFDSFMGRGPAGRGIFLTCGYAVENYVCSEQAFEAYIRTVLCLDETEFDVRGMVSEYTALMVQFHSWLAPIYGAAMSAISKERKIDLNKLKVDEHFTKLLCGKSLPQCKRLPELASIGIEQTDFTDASYERGKEFADLPALQWMRGKFLMIALTRYLRMRSAELHNMHKAGTLAQFNRTATAGLNETILFTQLTGLALPTERLREYLDLASN